MSVMRKSYVDGALMSTWQRFAHGDSYGELKDSVIVFVAQVDPWPFGEYDYVLEWFQERAEELGRQGIMSEVEIERFRQESWEIFNRYGFVAND